MRKGVTHITFQRTTSALGLAFLCCPSATPIFASPVVANQVGKRHHARALRRRRPRDGNRVGEELPGQPSHAPARLPRGQADLHLRTPPEQPGTPEVEEVRQRLGAIRYARDGPQRRNRVS